MRAIDHYRLAVTCLSNRDFAEASVHATLFEALVLAQDDPAYDPEKDLAEREEAVEQAERAAAQWRNDLQHWSRAPLEPVTPSGDGPPA